MKEKGILYKGISDKTWSVNESKVIEQLINEAQSLPNGFDSEVFFDKGTGKLSFSSPMTRNNWSREPDKVGRIESLDISNIEGFKDIDLDFVEVDDDCNETDPNFKDSEYERYYPDSSIITMDEALDRLSEAASSDEWYQDIIEEIEKRLEK